MTDTIPDVEPYLAPAQAERIEAIDALNALPLGTDQSYPGAGTLFPNILGNLLRITAKDFVALQGHTFTKPTGQYTAEDITPHLQDDAFVGAVVNSYYGVYGLEARLATGYSVANDDPKNISQGFELGKRIITERARNIGLTMAAGCILLVNKTLASDDPSLLERAKIRHQVDHLKKVVDIPPREGERFDTNLQRVRIGDFGRGESLHTMVGKGILGRLLTGRKLVSAVARIQMSATDPARMNEALEEAIDAFTLPVNMGIDDIEVDAIITTAFKVGRYIRNAAKRDSIIKQDPRLSHMTFLMNQLQGTSISRELSSFQKGVTTIKKRELELRR